MNVACRDEEPLRPARLSLSIVVLSLGVCTGAQAQCDILVHADDPEASSYFGAAISLDAEALLVGAELDDPYGNASGSAYFFTGGHLGWVQESKVTPSDPAPGQNFGNDVSVFGDMALVGAVGDALAGPNTGAAYVFQDGALGWVQLIKLVASDASANSLFGCAVRIDGDLALVGARGEGGNAGAVYAYRRSGGTWTEVQKIQASDGEGGDYFGESIDLAGSWAIVGAPGDDDFGSGSGSAYIFKLDAGAWVEQSKLLPSDPAQFNSFGEAVAIGPNVAVACSYRDGGHRGAAYVYEPSGSQWIEVSKLVAGDPYPGAEFGYSVAADGGAIVVGARFGGLPADESGAVYFFENHAGWSEVFKLQPAASAPLDEVGFSVDLDGETIVSGAPQADVDQADEGAAFAFEGSTVDCNGNGRRDCEDVASGNSRDDNANWKPDECESLGSEYCASTTNSSGVAGESYAIGSSTILEEDLTLVALGLPTNEYGYFLMSATQGFVPHFGGSDGNLCLGGHIYRFNSPPQGKVLNSGNDGFFTYRPNLTDLPQGVVFLPGETWNFQSWFRDVFTSNTSTGISVGFQ